MIGAATAVFFYIKKAPENSVQWKQDFLYRKAFAVAEVIASYVGHYSLAVIADAVFVIVSVSFAISVACEDDFTVLAVFAHAKACAIRRSCTVFVSNQICMFTLKTVLKLIFKKKYVVVELPSFFIADIG